jgi:hypothetical protein
VKTSPGSVCKTPIWASSISCTFIYVFKVIAFLDTTINRTSGIPRKDRVRMPIGKKELEEERSKGGKTDSKSPLPSIEQFSIEEVASEDRQVALQQNDIASIHVEALVRKHLECVHKAESTGDVHQ